MFESNELHGEASRHFLGIICTLVSLSKLQSEKNWTERKKTCRNLTSS